MLYMINTDITWLLISPNNTNNGSAPLLINHGNLKINQRSSMNPERPLFNVGLRVNLSTPVLSSKWCLSAADGRTSRIHLCGNNAQRQQQCVHIDHAGSSSSVCWTRNISYCHLQYIIDNLGTGMFSCGIYT